MPRRGALLCLLSSALLAPLPGAAQEAPPAGPQAEAALTRFEEAPLQLLYRPYLSTLVLALHHQGEFLLPLIETLTRLQINHRLDPQRGRISGFYLREDTRYEIDFPAGRARIGGREAILESGAVVATELEFYVPPALLGQLFGWRVRVNPGAMSVEVRAEQELPVAEAARRRERLAQREPRGPATYDGPIHFPRQRRILDGGMLEYQFSAVQPQGSTALELRAGLELLGGDLEARARAGHRSDAFALGAGDLRWRYVLGDRPLLSQVTLGRVFSTGLHSRSLQGVEITNRPLEMRRQLATHVIEGETLPEWEVELFVNERAYASTVADVRGRYRFEVPLGYGTTLVRLRHHGPTGELREEQHAVQVPFTFLPPGRVDYSLAAGRLLHQEGAAAQGSLAFGVTDWLTGRGGVEFTTDSLAGRTQLYAGLSARLARSYNLALEAAPAAHYRATLEAAFPGQRSLAAALVRYDDDGPGGAFRPVRELSARGFAPVSVLGTPLTLRLHGVGRGYRDGHSAYEGEAEVAAGLARIRPALGYRFAGSTGPGSGLVRRRELRLSGHASSGAGRRTPWPLRRLFVRGALGYDLKRGRGQELQLGVNRLVGRDKALDASYRRDLLAGVDQFELRLQLNLAQLRATTLVQRTPSGSSVAQAAAGVVGLDRESGRLLLTSRAGVGQAGAAIRLFLDENGNERRDPGEELLPGARLRFDRGADTRQRRGGVLHASELAAYRRYAVTVDPGSLPNPMLGTRYPTFAFVADPNRFKAIDVPVFVAGAVDGVVLRRLHGADRPVPGLRIHLRSSDGGFAAVLPVFADGTFYHLGLPPGRYTAEVDSAQLEFLGVASEPRLREFEVRATREGDVVEGVDFLLVPGEAMAREADLEPPA